MYSVFELFKIGIGPSSSHTVGPMVAACRFAGRVTLPSAGFVVSGVKVVLYGSLAWTGKGHATDKAVMLGLAGQMPQTVDPDKADEIVGRIRTERKLNLGGLIPITFDSEVDLVFDSVTPAPKHPNTLSFAALNAAGEVVQEERWCSIGGGFVVPEAEVGATTPANELKTPYPYASGRQLLDQTHRSGLTIAELVMANECARRPKSEVEEHLDAITRTMMSAIDRGMKQDGLLPGGLTVRRRARRLYERLKARRAANTRHPVEPMDWVSLYAIAVNEENASGSRIVTAPTNGAAGVVPAVLRYYRDFCDGANESGMRVFLLTATAVGGLFKLNASISGAEVGCQGEVGVACSMAAAGLAAALGGTDAQVENAAEIGMEHHLGMTCDPIGGLVQIPCIERNAFGAVKAITAASLALAGDGEHKVSLDQVIRTMRETGADMQSKYKETSLGGLAVNVVEC